jgi:hypothetical protein
LSGADSSRLSEHGRGVSGAASAAPPPPIHRTSYTYTCRGAPAERSLARALRASTIPLNCPGHGGRGLVPQPRSRRASLRAAPDWNDPIRAALAHSIIALAKAGERDAERLCDGALRAVARALRLSRGIDRHSVQVETDCFFNGAMNIFLYSSEYNPFNPHNTLLQAPSNRDEYADLSLATRRWLVATPQQTTRA